MCQSSGGISTDTAGGGGTGSIVVSKRMRGAFQGIRVQNPFTFKVGQVFTGFGVGCGVGIGVGRPINMGAIPVVNQVMSATRGATDAFSGVTRHVNDALRKFGAKNIEAGIGCGVGFGHGFGVGLALKPGIMNQIQSSLIQVMTKMMSKFGMGPNFPIGPGALPGSLQNGMSMMSGPLSQSPMGNMMQLGTNSQDNTSQMLTGYESLGSSFYQSFASSSSPDLSVGSRTEKVIGNFLQNPVLRKGDDAELYNLVLKHQRIIEELREENEKLRRILIEDLKVSPSKIEDSYSSYSYRHKHPCADCFECRRKQRRK